MANGENYAWLQLLVDTSFASRFLIGSDAKILFANAAAESLFGYSADELVGKPIDIIFSSASDQTLALPQLDSPVRLISGDDQEIRGKTKDSSELSLRVGVSPIRTLTGTFLAVTVFDITKYKQIEKELRERASLLEAANQKISRFAYLASHDLQEPLRKIAAFASLLKTALAEGDGPTAAHASEVVSHSAARARDLVTGMLDYCLSSSSAPNLEIIDVREEINQVLDDLSEPILESGAKIQNLVAKNVKVKADRLQFMRLLSNLITNSLKFHKDGESPDVTVSASDDAGYGVELFVQDKGIGFEPAQAEDIFEPFARLRSYSNIPGNGIGLAAVRAICRQHGWTVKAESQPGQGATFKVEAPIEPRKPPETLTPIAPLVPAAREPARPR
ncbi:sensor histidine kinase [Methylocystis bryophila]|uniref:histidine kinase n=1 Tax=Methylocystis bryophila TaxID=655015 RepID=A0A1W6N181_9HYPH|nr:ATP-binding protein [Methylocystis bryophila]ARN83576.1 hypothetical protein B1812_10970 [Methylocystis bryophila]